MITELVGPSKSSPRSSTTLESRRSSLLTLLGGPTLTVIAAMKEKIWSVLLFGLLAFVLLCLFFSFAWWFVVCSMSVDHYAYFKVREQRINRLKELANRRDRFSNDDVFLRNFRLSFKAFGISYISLFDENCFIQFL